MRMNYLLWNWKASPLLNPGIETDNQELGGNFSSGHQDYFPPSEELFAARNVDPIAQRHPRGPINVSIYFKFTGATLCRPIVEGVRSGPGTGVPSA
jgi:hypothetical protein